MLWSTYHTYCVPVLITLSSSHTHRVAQSGALPTQVSSKCVIPPWICYLWSGSHCFVFNQYGACGTRQPPEEQEETAAGSVSYNMLLEINRKCLLYYTLGRIGCCHTHSKTKGGKAEAFITSAEGACGALHCRVMEIAHECELCVLYCQYDGECILSHNMKIFHYHLFRYGVSYSSRGHLLFFSYGHVLYGSSLISLPRKFSTIPLLC